MILSAVLLPVAVVAILLAVERLRLPVFVAIIAVVIGYGLAADMSFQSIGRAFGVGFVQTLERFGLVVVAGSLVAKLMLSAPARSPFAALAGAIAGLGSSAAGGLALLQPVANGAARRAIGLALTLLAVQALIAPAPIAVGAAAVLKVDLGSMAMIALPLAALIAGSAWFYLTRILPADELRADKLPTREPRGGVSLALAVVAVPILLLIVHSLTQVPIESLARGKARDLIIALSSPMILSALVVLLAVIAVRATGQRSWSALPEALANTSWAPLLLAVGTAGGFGRVLDETGMAELLAERVIDPRLGVMAPFLAAAIVKTLQGGSLAAVLTSSGMVEPMLPALGLDSANGRILAAAAAGVGSMTVCHFNDPLFWIAAHMGGLSPRRALLAITGGSLVLGVVAAVALVMLSLVLR